MITSQALALDPGTLDGLRTLSRDNRSQALDEVAQQFEGLLIQQMMESMRNATVFKSDLLNSSESRLYESMLDQQLAITLSEKGIGIKDYVLKALSSQRELADELTAISNRNDVENNSSTVDSSP